MTNYDDLKLAVEAMSGGRNTVLLDDIGEPSIVVPFPKLKYSDVITGGLQQPLPAFVVDTKEIDVIYESKYQNIIVNDRAYSLPMKDPATVIDFDRAVQVCKNKGTGWHLQTNALWAAIALWSKKNGTMPHGNSNYGQSTTYPHEKGVPSYQYNNNGTNVIGRTATGSGPVTWYHNYDSSGIADLNGNVWEWCGGMRLVDGEIQIIPYGNAMRLDCNMSATSTEWKAIMPNGDLVNPGTAGALKWDYAANKITLATALTTQADALKSTSFESLGLANGVTAPTMLKGLGLHPAETGYGNASIWMNNSGERIPVRGGGWYSGADVGVFALYLHYLRANMSVNFGFRAAYYE